MRGRIIVGIAMLAVTAACSKSSAPQKEVSGSIRIVGSTNVVPLLRGVADAFKKTNPKVTFDWRLSNTNYGFGDPSANADFVAAIRPPKDKEKERFGEGVEIARDALCAIVHKSNPVSSLTKEKLEKLMAATALPPKWTEIGGPDLDVRAIMPADARQTMSLLLKYFGVDRSQLAFFSNEGANDQAIEGVKGDPTAIAVIGCSSAKKAAKAGALKVVPIGPEPTVEAIASGKAEIPFTLYIVPSTASLTKKEQVKAFLEFAKDRKNTEPLLKELELAPPSAAK